jgi:V8-like Glu-specific endopeptidase
MDVYPNKYSIGDEEHYYYKVDDGTPVQLPFWGYGKYKKNNMMYDESKIFVIDAYSSFYDNYDNYMTKLGYREIKERFKEIILNRYYCYEICIFNKNPNQIFVMYLGISNEDFLDFLTNNSYPNPIIEFVKMHMSNGTYHINNEITIVYDIKTQSIIRSGFYGVI